MKKTIFALIMGSMLNANAQILSFCDHTAKLTAENEFTIDFPDQEILVTETKATRYVGWHTKEYIATITGEVSTVMYAIEMFEYETPRTACIVDAIKRLN